MGDHGGCAQLSGSLPNGLLSEETAKLTRVLDADRWLKAEGQTAELIARIQPNQSSEERRNAVANYVQRLILKCFSCRVSTFGSVPLKTYLPDGDIDLTAFSDNENLKDAWATAVCGVLENEEKSENAEFCVKEVKYIQAEVKLVKCLVENIVMDISFNQVGGLCTLCFLEEMDNVINQNHLFKRSIILIKAWCYYESRILGAHHGLISTYALETLVLYIFHVFNSSFAGPLEVLYRFLEFFGNFDWGNYCVSLWGPVPISSLPDMTAEPPRKDNSKLLFSKRFLDNCNSVFSVTPGGKETHSQPFVPKHFNVVDPLRTNNNLGRSVSKGNFFRIRSAFAFGAKRLARLIECPKDDIIAEVNQFFMNTWKRHMSGDRPDVSLDLWHLQPLKTVPVEESNNLKSTTSVNKKIENIVLQIGEEHLAETDDGLHNATSEVLANNPNIFRINNPSVVSCAQSQIYYRKQFNSRLTDRHETSNSPSGSVQSDKSQKLLNSNCSVNDQEELSRFQFARTRYSPELTEVSIDSSQGRHQRVIETEKIQFPANIDSDNRRKNLRSEFTDNESSKSSLDAYISVRQTLCRKNLEVASDANVVLKSYHGDVGFTAMEEELASVSEKLEMQQREQDLVNMMGSSDIHWFNGQVQLPMHLVPLPLPSTFSPLSTSTGYAKGNLAGDIPSNLSLIGPPWGPNMQFGQTLFSFPVPNYFRAATYRSNVDNLESFNDDSAVTELNSENNGHGNPNEDDVGLSEGSNFGDGGPQIHLDGKQQKLDGGLSPSPVIRDNSSGYLPREQNNKLGREGRRLTKENYNDPFQAKTSRGSDLQSNFRSSNTRFSTLSWASSSRSKPASEYLRHQSAAKFPRLARNKCGSKPAFGKENNTLQFEGSSNHISSKIDDDTSGCIPLSTMENDMSERIIESATLATSHVRSKHFSEYESEQKQSDPLIPIAPVLVGTSWQRGANYSKVLPGTFVATGPPVPFLMLPFGGFTSNSGNPDGYAKQIDREEEPAKFQESSSGQNIVLVESLDQSEALSSPKVSRIPAPESSEELSSDIFNIDSVSHWQNLVYGRSCQNSYPGPFMYTSPVARPPIYLPSHYPWDGPGKLLSSDLHYTQMTGHNPLLVPIMPFQPGSDRASGVFQDYADETPTYRGGTGTYLPNSKVSFGDHRQSGSRNHEGNCNYDKDDPVERSWVRSKPRAFGHGHGRNRAERPRLPPDQLAASKNQEKKWESWRSEPVASNRRRGRSFSSTNSSYISESAPGMHPQTASSSEGVNASDPTIPLGHSYDQGVGYGSHAEPLKFGSFRPVHQSSGNGGAPKTNGGIVSGLYDKRHGSNYKGGTPQSSQD
ncbi:unnamed protein product [Musa acuminata subsp. burmannicoides]